MKKTLALLLALFQLLVCFAVASAEGTDKLGGLTLPLVDKPTTLTMYFGSQYEMTEDTWLFKKLYELTGIKVVPVCYTKDIANDKFANYLASAELPDIFISSYVGDFSTACEYGDQGAFAATNDYLDIMPNFKRLYIDDAANYEIYSTYASKVTGNNYYMPIYGLNRDVNYGFMYRADVLKELGVEPWTDTESFIEVLRAYKKAYPDSYPFASKAQGNFIRFASYFDMNNLPYAYDYEKGEYYIACTSERYKAMLDFFKQLYNEGLLDPEFLTDAQDPWTAKYLNNKAFVMEDWIGRMALMNAQAQDTIPGFDLVYGRPIGNGKAKELEKFNNWGAMVANNQNTEAAMKLVDFLYSDLGSELMTLGIEGDNFRYGENGEILYNDIAGAADIVKLEETYGMWIEGLYLRPSRKSVYYAFTDHEQFAQDLINNECGYSRVMLPCDLEPEDQEKLDLLNAELTPKMNAFLGNYVMNASYGEAEWNNWVETAMKNYGDAILALLNK